MIQFQETDTAAGCGSVAMCSGLSTGLQEVNRQASIGGSPGSGINQVKSGNSSSTVWRMIQFQTASNDLNSMDCPAGTWVLRLNITAAASNSALKWDSTYVCQASSGCSSLNTIASLTGQTIDLSTTGVKSMTLNGSAVGLSATDAIYIVLGFKGATLATFSFKPDQLIDTPLTVGVVHVKGKPGWKKQKKQPRGRPKRKSFPFPLSSSPFPFRLKNRKPRIKPPKLRKKHPAFWWASIVLLPPPLNAALANRARGKSKKQKQRTHKRSWPIHNHPGLTPGQPPALVGHLAVLEYLPGRESVLESLSAKEAALEDLSASAAALEALSASALTKEALSATPSIILGP